MHLAVALLAKSDGIDVGSILGYIVVGAIVGVLARFLVPGKDPMGIIGTIVLGILGAVIGGWAAGRGGPARHRLTPTRNPDTRRPPRRTRGGLSRPALLR
jgi:uncharacterized membrane protein YeaQ/YmgE (transglycosylase-associated protein family)